MTDFRVRWRSNAPGHLQDSDFAAARAPEQPQPQPAAALAQPALAQPELGQPEQQPVSPEPQAAEQLVATAQQMGGISVQMEV